MSDQVNGNREDLRVANIVEEGRYGGPQARIVGVAQKLKRERINTIVVVPKKDSAVFCEKLIKKGIQANRIILHRLTRQKSCLISYFVFFIPELVVLHRLIRKENIDIVHCNGSWQIKGVIAGRLAGSKVVWHLNDTQMPAFIRSIFKFMSLNFCDAFIIAGKRVKDYYLRDRRFSKKQIMVIQAPVDTSIFNPQKVRPDQEIAYSDELKIVTVGNINPTKGIEYFIEMASILNKQYNNLVFFVVGSHLASQSGYSEKVVELVRTSIVKDFHFYGPVDNIPSVLKATDIYVCSSIAEASPISVWEAMAMAKPIVSTDVGDVARFIKNRESGFVVAPRDPFALAEKVGLLIEDKDLRKKLGFNARNIALKHLDVDICAQKHEQLYREVMNG